MSSPLKRGGVFTNASFGSQKTDAASYQVTVPNRLSSSRDRLRLCLGSDGQV